MAIRPFFILLLLCLAQAQFIQHYNPKPRDWSTRPGRNIFTYDIYASQIKAYSQGTNAQPITVKANSDHS